MTTGNINEIQAEDGLPINKEKIKEGENIQGDRDTFLM